MAIRINKKQEIVLWVGVIAIVIILLYPPWLFVFSERPRGPKYADGVYSFIFSPPPIPVTSRSADGRETYFLKEYPR